MRPDLRRLSLIALALVTELLTGGCSSLRPVGSTTSEVAQRQIEHAGPQYRSIVIEPFVVVTNAPPPIVNEAEVLVRAVREQFRELFATPPTAPTTGWLFASERAFREEGPKLGKPAKTLSDVTGRSLSDLDADIRRFAKERAAKWRSDVDQHSQRRLHEERR